MSLGLIIYLASIADEVDRFASVVLVLGGLATVISGFIYFLGDFGEKELSRCKSLFKFISITTATVVSLGVLVPNSKTIYSIVAVGEAKKIIEDPRVREVSGKVFDLINKKLDESLDK